MIPEKLLNSMEERYQTYGLPDYEVKRLITEVRALQSENARLCPVADLDTVASLRAELQLAQEQVQTLERMLDAANQDARDLMKVIDDFAQPNAGDDPDAYEAIERHNARYQSEIIKLSPGWNPGLYNPEHGGTYRVRSLKQGADTLDEKTCCFDAETGWETMDEVIEWKELN
jgi:hypothetical protein